jgi:hypothetical protein
MRGPSRRLLPVLALSASIGLPSAAGASLLTLSGSRLEIGISGWFPPIAFPQNGSGTLVSVSSGAGSFTEPAGLFTGNVALPTALFTGVALIHRIFIGNLSNGTKTVAPGAGGGGHASQILRGGGLLGGPGPLGGTMFINVLGLSNLAVPLVVGNTGASTDATFGSLGISVRGTGWTTGVVTVTGVTTNGVNTVQFGGYDNRTAAHNGVVQLVSPFKVTTNVVGNLPGLAVQTLTFSGAIPEPASLVLLATAAAALAALGRRRRRR